MTTAMSSADAGCSTAGALQWARHEEGVRTGTRCSRARQPACGSVARCVSQSTQDSMADGGRRSHVGSWLLMAAGAMKLVTNGSRSSRW